MQRIPVTNRGLLGLLPVSRLGDGPEDSNGGNRLLGLKPGSILRRGTLFADAWLAYEHPTSHPKHKEGLLDQFFYVYFDGLPGQSSDADFEVLSEIIQTPTQTEVDDAVLLDSLITEGERSPYTGITAPVRRWSVGTKYQLGMDLACVASTGIRKPAHPWKVQQAIAESGNPMVCKRPLPTGFRVGWPTVYDYFDIDLNAGSWEEIRQAVQNQQVMREVLTAFPFPRPIPAAPGFWYHANRDALAEAVNSGLNITPPLARMMITAFTLNTYETVAARIIDWAEERAEKKKKWAIVRAVGMAAVGAIWGAALAPLLSSLIPAGVPVTGTQAASAITGALQEQYTKEELDRIAGDLEQTARVFAVNDPLFAEEVRKLRDTFSYLGEAIETSAEAAQQIKEQQENPLPTPEEIGVNPEYPGDAGPSPVVVVGIGALTAGALYFLLG